MTTGPCSCSSPCLGPPLPYTQNVQIQSITDESRSSIRRKNQGPGQGTSLSRQSSLMDDTQEDEVAHFLTPPTVPHCHPCPAPSRQACLYKAEPLDPVNESQCFQSQKFRLLEATVFQTSWFVEAHRWVWCAIIPAQRNHLEQNKYFIIRLSEEESSDSSSDNLVPVLVVFNEEPRNQFQ